MGLAENYALYREFMEFVKEKHRDVYDEFWAEKQEEDELLNKVREDLQNG